MFSTWVFGAILMASAASGVQIQPTNVTLAGGDGTGVDIALPYGNTIQVFSLLQPLVSGAGSLPNYGLSDNLFHATGLDQQNLTGNDIAYMSCDSSDYPGFYSLVDVFQTALGVNTTAIILYSLTSRSCNISGLETAFQYIYSMPNSTVAQGLLDRINNSPSIDATILYSDSSRISNNSSSTDGGSTSTSSGYGSSPKTAVAMIILYSVTGIITAMFLVIIITGAVRAHRHPERYGPRNIRGRTRQSRARGLARAMLDTIPIVKFGEEQPEEAKPGDVEMADTQETTVHSEEQNKDRTTEQIDHTMPRQSMVSARSGIGAAEAGNDGPNVVTGTPAVQTDEALGCSICTDDFQAGQDLRVLPCDHKFHPECIDPWLLNVSGTCPLCRIDLRPQGAQESQEEEGELPPPINGYSGMPNRISMRRSLMIGLGLDRGHNQEQRVAAARGLRDRRETQGQQNQAVDEGRRRRLRERLGIRTRRGQEMANTTIEENAAEATETSQVAEQQSTPVNDSEPTRTS